GVDVRVVAVRMPSGTLPRRRRYWRGSRDRSLDERVGRRPPGNGVEERARCITKSNPSAGRGERGPERAVCWPRARVSRAAKEEEATCREHGSIRERRERDVARPRPRAIHELVPGEIRRLGPRVHNLDELVRERTFRV